MLLLVKQGWCHPRSLLSRFGSTPGNNDIICNFSPTRHLLLSHYLFLRRISVYLCVQVHMILGSFKARSLRSIGRTRWIVVSFLRLYKITITGLFMRHRKVMLQEQSEVSQMFWEWIWCMILRLVEPVISNTNTQSVGKASNESQKLPAPVATTEKIQNPPETERAPTQNGTAPRSVQHNTLFFWVCLFGFL